MAFWVELELVCRNFCERLYSKMVVGQCYYDDGKKYCRRCEVYYSCDDLFFLCCGMAL